jgi:hypothetical protein
MIRYEHLHEMSLRGANRSPDEHLIAPDNYLLFFAVPGKLNNDCRKEGLPAV